MASSPVSQKPYVTPKESWKTGKILKHCDNDVIPTLRTILDDSEKEKFRRTCLGHFLHLHADFNFSGIIVHNLLLWEIQQNREDEMWFRLGQNEVRFSKVEFCLITGLKFGELPDTENIEATPSGILAKYFGGRDKVTGSSIKTRLLQGEFEDEDDKLKLGLLYLLNRFIKGHDERQQVPTWQFHLVDNLEAFNGFPWGTCVYCNSILHFKKAVTNRIRDADEVSYNAYGFVWALHVFAFEVIPATNMHGMRLSGSDLPLPRICRWRFHRRPHNGDCKKIFTNSLNLKPTTAERQAPYYVGVEDSVVPGQPSIRDDEMVESPIRIRATNSSSSLRKTLKVRERIPTEEERIVDESEPNLRERDVEREAPGTERIERDPDVYRRLIAMESKLELLEAKVNRMDSDNKRRHQEQMVILKSIQLSLQGYGFGDRDPSLPMSNPIPNEGGMADSAQEGLAPAGQCDETEATAGPMEEVVTAFPCNDNFGAPAVVDKELPSAESPKRTAARDLALVPVEATDNVMPVVRTRKRSRQLCSPYVELHTGYKKAKSTHTVSAKLQISDKIIAAFNDFMKGQSYRNVGIGHSVSVDWFKALVDNDEWIDDSHIDTYLHILRRRQKELPEQYAQDICICDPWLYTAFYYIYNDYQKDPDADCPPTHSNFEAHKWEEDFLDRVRGKFSRDCPAWDTVNKLMVPCHVGGSHWLLVVIDLRKFPLRVYDSFRQEIPTEARIRQQNPFRWMLTSYMASGGYFIQKSDAKMPDLPLSCTLEPKNKVPQQRRSGNCGPHMLYIIEHLLLRKHLKYTDKDMSVIRNHMAMYIFANSTVDDSY